MIQTDCVLNVLKIVLQMSPFGSEAPVGVPCSGRDVTLPECTALSAAPCSLGPTLSQTLWAKLSPEMRTSWRRRGSNAGTDRCFLRWVSPSLPRRRRRRDASRGTLCAMFGGVSRRRHANSCTTCGAFIFVYFLHFSARPRCLSPRTPSPARRLATSGATLEWYRSRLLAHWPRESTVGRKSLRSRVSAPRRLPVARAQRS